MQAIIRANGQTFNLNAGASNAFDEFFAGFNVEHEGRLRRVHLMLHPKTDLHIEQIDLWVPCRYDDGSYYLADGYQSWAMTHENSAEGWSRLFKKRRRGAASGDLRFYQERFRRGQHTWHYGYVRQGERTFFAGSLNEWAGFTAFVHEPEHGRMVVTKDCRGLQLRHSFPVFDLVLMEGDFEACFARYVALQDVPPRLQRRLSGRILETTAKRSVMSAIKSLRKNDYEYLLIHEGWQSKVGDWLVPAKHFGQNLLDYVAAIKEQGSKPALWIAPFVVSAKSNVAKRYSSWLVRDDDDNPVSAGVHPELGQMYALNVFSKEVRDYINGLLFAIAHQWGFEMLKLDWLYAAALAPPPDKTRGQAMYEAMQLLRGAIGEHKIMWASGLPFGAAIGHADMCTVGAESWLHWENDWLTAHHHQKDKLQRDGFSTLSRWPLDGRAFWLEDLGAPSGAQAIGLEMLMRGVYELHMRQDGRAVSRFVNLTDMEILLSGPQMLILPPHGTLTA